MVLHGLRCLAKGCLTSARAGACAAVREGHREDLSLPSWIGAIATAALFTVGKTAIGLYIGQAALDSTYGAAGSLLVVLVWVYYSSLILFFGAEFTHVYARRRGSQLDRRAETQVDGQLRAS
jgi:uncharacterized BrkB/YihY/UPF0761 family membrane protein